LSTSQLGSSTSRAFVGHTVLGDFAGHVVFGTAEKQGAIMIETHNEATTELCIR
jgi:hypothetical protein